MSRAQRRQTRVEALRRRKNRTRKQRFSSLLAFVAAVVVCGSVAFAAPEITDAPTPEQLQALKSQNSSFAQAYDTQEAFVGGEKTSVGLCGFANKAREEGWNYVYGGKGQRMTSGLLTSIITGNLNDVRSPYLRDGYIASTLQQVGNRATDCSGLIMNYMWWAGDASDPIRALCPSIGNYNANAMLEVAREKGKIASIPEIPGLLVHSNGHVGIYIGNGEVIEARGVKYGVTKTLLSERSWKYWSKSPWVDYDLCGIYDIAGRWVFLDGGEDIGQERWVAKYVYGDASKGSTYVPVSDSEATFGGALPAVYDADTMQAAGTELTLVDRILAVIDTLEYNPKYGYQFEGHWYIILVDEQGIPEAILNDPAEGEPADPEEAPAASAEQPEASGAADQEGSAAQEPGEFVPPADSQQAPAEQEEAVFVAPDPVMDLEPKATEPEPDGAPAPEPEDFDDEMRTDQLEAAA